MGKSLVYLPGETYDFSFGSGIMRTYSIPLRSDGKIDSDRAHKFTLGEGVGADYGKTTTISLFQTN